MKARAATASLLPSLAAPKSEAQRRRPFTPKVAVEFFIVPFILLLSTGNQPMAVGIFGLFDEQGQANLGYVAAYARIYMLPIVLLYLGLSRSIGGAFRLVGAVTG